MILVHHSINIDILKGKCAMCSSAWRYILLKMITWNHLCSWKVYSAILWEFRLILSFQETLFLSETLEKITFNPGLWGKLLLILENELETSPSSSPDLSYRDKEPDVDDDRGERMLQNHSKSVRVVANNEQNILSSWYQLCWSVHPSFSPAQKLKYVK